MAQKLDFKNLAFGYLKTNCFYSAVYEKERWGKVVKNKGETLNLHIAANCLHYGQACFEGLKVFQGKDKKIRIFRWQDNFQRLNNSAQRLLMPEIPKEIFQEVLFNVIQANLEFIPPMESGASLYVRPVYLGIGEGLGVAPANKYLFLILVSPVGPYFKGGFQTIDVLIERDFDRSAPQGVGNIKAAGNYAASLQSLAKAKKSGCATALFLDAKTKKYIDECGHANFFGIKKNSYITPKSTSILPSITNKSLKTIAKDLGLKVRERRIALKELASFSETGACGTAAIINPIRKIIDLQEKKEYFYGEKPGKISTKLYETLRAIQYGDKEDKHGWVTVL